MLFHTSALSLRHHHQQQHTRPSSASFHTPANLLLHRRQHEQEERAHPSNETCRAGLRCLTRQPYAASHEQAFTPTLQHVCLSGDSELAGLFLARRMLGADRIDGRKLGADRTVSWSMVLFRGGWEQDTRTHARTRAHTHTHRAADCPVWSR